MSTPSHPIDPAKNALPCPCGSARSLADCCGPYLARPGTAPTAEALMRSRYSAHVLVQTDYLWETWEKNARRGADKAAIAHFAASNQWLGLEILDTCAGAPADDTGIVEFIARFRAKDIPGAPEEIHHERSSFKRFGSGWRYVDDLNQSGQ